MLAPWIITNNSIFRKWKRKSRHRNFPPVLVFFKNKKFEYIDIREREISLKKFERNSIFVGNGNFLFFFFWIQIFASVWEQKLSEMKFPFPLKNWTSNFLILGEDLTDWKPVFVELSRVSPVSRVDEDVLLVTLRLYPPPRGSVARMLAKWRTMRAAYRAGDGSMRAVTCETTAAAASTKTILPSSIRRALLFNALSNSVMESRGRRRRSNKSFIPARMDDMRKVEKKKGIGESLIHS